MRIGEPFAHCKLAMVICRFLYRCAAGARLGTERTASLDLITALLKQGSSNSLSRNLQKEQMVVALSSFCSKSSRSLHIM